MEDNKLIQTVEYIVSTGAKVAEKYTTIIGIPLDYVAIFTQSQEEYMEYIHLAQSLGKEIQTIPTGNLFRLNETLHTSVGDMVVVKIRKPDISRSQRGCVDFRIPNYAELKMKYQGHPFVNVIDRYEYEMIEIREDTTDVLVYFPSLSFTNIVKTT
jgi:hypothetical protein